MAFKCKLAGIYKITHLPTEQYYIGMSVSIFERWQNHYTGLKTKKHSSTKFMELWIDSDPIDWKFEILESISLTQFRTDNKLKGKVLESAFRKYLLLRERYHMSLHSITYCLNKDSKYFS